MFHNLSCFFLGFLNKKKRIVYHYIIYILINVYIIYKFYDILQKNCRYLMVKKNI